jgi:hypothetical protein
MVRLRWLANLINRKGYDLATVRAGTVQLHLIRRSQSILHRVLPVQAEDLLASLKDNQIAMVSADRWPKPLIVRIERNPAVLTHVERAHLMDRTSMVLNRLALPIVLRGPELEDWRAEQVRTHQPAFTETSSVDPAHLSGANVLLRLESRVPSAQMRVLTIDCVNIATGENLSKLAIEGHESQWPSTVDAIMADLEFMLRDLIESLPVHRVRSPSFAAPGARQP